MLQPADDSDCDESMAVGAVEGCRVGVAVGGVDSATHVGNGSPTVTVIVLPAVNQSVCS